MASALREDLERQLGELTRRRDQVGPGDILEIVESVMASLQDDRAAINAHLHADIAALASYITAVKTEIAEVRADEISGKYLPGASDELGAIVGATEQATNGIFEAVEAIESLTPTMTPETAEQVTQAVVSVYEACSFQDITGQRIAKVVKALQTIEGKVQALLAALGEEAASARPSRAEGAAENRRDHGDLMNGPQLPGRGISQDDVDALLASRD